MKLEDIPYSENGSFYIFTCQHYKSSRNRLGGRIGYWVLPEEYGMQIDTELDFKLLEAVFRSDRNQ